ncbi:hypothetical protein D9M70_508220 [compost metagenome]
MFWMKRNWPASAWVASRSAVMSWTTPKSVCGLPATAVWLMRVRNQRSCPSGRCQRYSSSRPSLASRALSQAGMSSGWMPERPSRRLTTGLGSRPAMANSPGDQRTSWSLRALVQWPTRASFSIAPCSSTCCCNARCACCKACSASNSLVTSDRYTSNKGSDCTASNEVCSRTCRRWPLWCGMRIEVTEGSGACR